MLETVDLKRTITRPQYDRLLLKLQLELRELALELYRQKRRS